MPEFPKIPPCDENAPIPEDATCQEAGPASLMGYVACGNRATTIVKSDVDRRSYYMCFGCANHNVTNRGMSLLKGEISPPKSDGPPEYMKPKKIKKGEADPETEDGKQFEIKGKELMALKASKEEFKERLSEVNAEIDKLEEQLASLMIAKGVDLFRVKGVATFFTSVKNFTSVTDKDAFIAYLDESGQGAMAKRSVHPSTLNAWAKEQLEAGKELPKSLNNFSKIEVNTRKA